MYSEKLLHFHALLSIKHLLTPLMSLLALCVDRDPFSLLGLEVDERYGKRVYGTCVCACVLKAD